ncbi:Autophagy protein 22 [Actinomortierella ambigua]|nr:Autophagy protein 22 [Actinomortierella ambigua]
MTGETLMHPTLIPKEGSSSLSASPAPPSPAPYSPPTTEPGIGRWSRLKSWLFQDDIEALEELQPYVTEKLVRKRELAGYFALGFGYDAWSSSVTAVFMPLVLQALATSASRLATDHSVACSQKNDVSITGSSEKCVVPFGWIWVEPTSYALLINVISVWCSMVLSFGTSAWADHGRLSVRLLVLFCFGMTLATALTFVATLQPSWWWVAGLLSVIGSSLGAAALNLYDGLLPVLTRYHPKVVRAQLDYGPTSVKYHQQRIQTSTFISGTLAACGYAGGLLLTVLSAIVLFLMDDTGPRGMAYTMILAFVFTMVFVWIMWRQIHQRTFPPFPKDRWFWTYGYVRIGRTIGRARQLKTMFLYLIAWFLLGDGLSAATSMAVLIAQRELGATSQELIVAVLIQFVAAGLAIAFWVYLQNQQGVHPLKIVILNSALFGLLPMYCLLGLIEASPVGLKHLWEVYMIAAFFGVFSGAIYSAARVVYALFIPYGHENELYALFEMASVSSSWIAPLVSTAIIETYGLKHIWWFLASQFFIPACMLIFVNPDKGIAQAQEFYIREQAAAQADEDDPSSSGGITAVKDEQDVERDTIGGEKVAKF